MKRILFFTGAGISAESGISTFRDSDGLWENHKIEEVCNINTWKQHRNKVFEFYNQRRLQLKDVEPNLIHKRIAYIQEYFEKQNIEVNIVTQNIDDLLERGGCKNVLHVHGNLKSMHCTACDHKWDIEIEAIDPDTVRCPKCNSNKGVKPNVVFFYENNALNYHLMKREFRKLEQGDCFIVMGTMGNVVRIESEVSVHNGFSILNNLEESPYIRAGFFTHVLYKKGTEAMKDIEYILGVK